MIAIRRAAPGDEAGIARVNVEAWHQAYGGRVPDAMAGAVTIERRRTMWQALLAAHAATHPTWVATGDDGAGKHAGDIVGFVTGSPAGGTVEGFRGELHMLFVDPAFQRRDIGRRLFHTMAEGLVAAGGSSAVAMVLDAPAALAFCLALGGVPVAHSDLAVAGADVGQTLFAWANLAALPLLPGTEP